jgi:hypothetical protein
MNSRGKSVGLLKESQFNAPDVFIPNDWSSYLDQGPVASSDFMQDVETLPVQRRQNKGSIKSSNSSRE